MTHDPLLRAVPVARRRYVAGFLRYAKSAADAERIFVTLKRHNFEPYFVATPAYWFVDNYDTGGPPSYTIRESARRNRMEAV